MWQVGHAVLDEIDFPKRSPSFAVGNRVCARAGTLDPDFPAIIMDGWAGKIIEVDETTDPVQYLVQWDENTVNRMSPDCRERCEMEDFALDQMWLLEDDLAFSSVRADPFGCDMSAANRATAISRLHPTTNRSNSKSACVPCRVQNGFATVNGHGRGYYASRGGVRMLVVERGANQCVRINDTIEVVVLEIGNGRVRVGVSHVASPDGDGKDT